MMGKVSKGVAFIFGMVSILSMFVIVAVISIFKLTETNELMIAAFLTAIVGMVTSYMGIEVVNNGVRGKCFRQEVADLDAKERGE
jgi:ABC-type Fe3+-siderophore transport system permease subunit